MRGFYIITLAALALLAGGHPTAWAFTGKNKAAANGSPGKSPAPKFDVPIPPKHSAEGVKLPYFDDKGHLQMFFNIEKATRLDPDHLDLRKAFMQTYDDKGAEDANVYMVRSVLDLNTRIVTSDIPVTVRRSDFQITGQKMAFDTQKRIGRMTGHVKMTIYNRQVMASQSPSPSPSPAAAQSPAPADSPTSSPSATP